MNSSVETMLVELLQLAKSLEATGYPREAMQSFGPEPESSLNAIEQSTGMRIPADLRALLSAHGGFFVRMDVDGLAVTFRNRPSFPQPYAGLIDALDSAWTWAEYRDPGEFPPEAIATLNAAFVCFGHVEVTENAFDHFFYDANGNYGVLRFDQEWMDDEAIARLHDLSAGINAGPTMTLEEVLLPHLRASRQILASQLRQFEAYDKAQSKK